MAFTQEEIKKILEIKGEVKGVVFQTDKEYVLLKWKKMGLEKLKKKAEELGVDIPYEGAETMDWYPIGKRVLSLLLIKETFGIEDGEIRVMGSMAPKFSVIVKLTFKLFTPIKKFAKEIPNYWREHYTQGELEVEKVNEKEKEMVLNLKEARFHPLLCLYLEGYFEGVMKFMYPSVQCRETKCLFRGDEVHQYYFKW